MPHPNKSQSPPDLRLPPSQRSDTSLSLLLGSMRTSRSFLSNASVRRIGSSRRARPTATAVADIFVRSLVMAGYCHEHSPRGRGLTTMSIKHLEGNTLNWERRGLGKTSKQFPCKGRPDSLGPRVQCLGGQRTQRMFNSSVAQKLETYDGEDHPTQITSTLEPSHGTRTQGVAMNRARRFEEESQLAPHERMAPERIVGEDGRYSERMGATTRNKGRNGPDHNLEFLRGIERYLDYQGPATKLYQHAANVYRAALPKSLDWKEAVEAAIDIAGTPRPLSRQRPDTTKTAIELSSVRKFLEAMWDKKKSNHYVFTLYRDLPSPGIIHLSKRTRGALLRRFAHPPDRRWVDARRYLALVEDMLTAGLPISRSLWSTAIHLAGRATGKVAKHDLIRAIGIWHQMEHLAGIQSDGVVFTILFDIAIKAGQYVVAERFMDEMARRNIQFGRAGKVSKIYYYGLIGDSDGISRAFDEFVADGEIVDTAVMNCLMAAFLKAGKTETAEEMYTRMVQMESGADAARDSDYKLTHATGSSLTAELVAYRERYRKLGRVLQLSASLKDCLPEHHRALQESFRLTPDTRTFHIFLSHHAHKTGNLNAFNSVLRDMEKYFKVPPRGMIYLLLFDGFARHGRQSKVWTAEKLRMVWKAYLRALYESKTRLNRGEYALPETLLWENPLGSNDDTATPPPTSTSSKLYTPLPSAAAKTKDGRSEIIALDHNQSDEDGVIDEGDDDIPNFDCEVVSDGRHHPEHAPDELVALERRIENGVFLGRRMIILILRAFGSCCGPDEIMDVWLRLERIWQPDRRKGLDVLAVKEELEKQMNKASKVP